MFSLWKEVKGIFRLSNKGRIKLSESALIIMNSYKQDSEGKLESGGVMIGRFIINSKNIVVDKVTVPMKGDKRTRNTFTRMAKPHQEIIDKEWKKSNGRSNYLGEWHTHPENFPDPSIRDFESWRVKLKNAIFSSRYLYFVIIGIEEYRIWEGDRRSLRIIRKCQNE